jgi:hypothetical protein
MRTTITILFFAAIAARSQPVGAGVKAGLPLNSAFTLVGAGFEADKPAYVAGPFVEIRLPASFAIEVAALYERPRIRYAFPSTGLERVTADVRASTWQFPLVVKYRLGGGTVRPFVLAGVAAYRVGSIEQRGEIIRQLPEDVRSALNRVAGNFVNGGGVAGGGVEFKAGPVRIAPELRFTRWAISKTAGFDVVTFNLEQSRAHLFVSLSF